MQHTLQQLKDEIEEPDSEESEPEVIAIANLERAIPSDVN
jgi:hypothetical protein